MVFKNLCVLVLWTKVFSVLEGLTLSSLEISMTSVVWTYDTFGNNFKMKHNCTKHLKESCRLGSKQYILKYFLKNALLTY